MWKSEQSCVGDEDSPREVLPPPEKPLSSKPQANHYGFELLALSQRSMHLVTTPGHLKPVSCTAPHFPLNSLAPSQAQPIFCPSRTIESYPITPQTLSLPPDGLL